MCARHPVCADTSFKLGRVDLAACTGLKNRSAHGGLATHADRMQAAARVLASSPHWLRAGGRDHFFASSSFNHPAPLSVRMNPLSKVLRCAAAGRYKAFLFGYKRSAKSAVGLCSIELPYAGPRQATFAAEALRRLHATDNRSSTRSGAAAATDARGARDGGRPTLLYFAGALDVCCYGQQTRCAVGKLAVAAWDAVDVLIKPQLPDDPKLAGPCLKAMQAALRKPGRLTGRHHTQERGHAHAHTAQVRDTVAAHARSDTRQLSAGGAGPDGSSGSGGGSARDEGAGLSAAQLPHGHGSLLTNGMLRQTDHDMVQSVWCLVPAGDSSITDRLYASIATGCLPIILADELKGAFASHVRYDTFWLRVPMKDFIRRPEQLLARLRAMDPNEVRARQDAMQRHRADVLYDVPDSAAGSLFLQEIGAKCLPLLRNETPPPKSGRSSWTRKCMQPGYAADVAKSILKGKSLEGDNANGPAGDDD